MDDVVEAIGSALVGVNAVRGPVNIGTGEGTSNAELARSVEREAVVSYRVVEAPPSHSVASIERAIAWWGFAPSSRVAERPRSSDAP